MRETGKKVRPVQKKWNDYYPFGMLQPGRNANSDDYRYGFQNQEKDDEVRGNGNSINYKYRMHDPRTGRFFALDPLASDYAHNSPYAFSENRVTDGVELEGLEYSSMHGSATDREMQMSIYEFRVAITNLPRRLVTAVHSTVTGNIIRRKELYLDGTYDLQGNPIMRERYVDDWFGSGLFSSDAFFETVSLSGAIPSKGGPFMMAKFKPTFFISTLRHAQKVTRGTFKQAVEASEKITAYRHKIKKPKSGNVGYLEGSVNGKDVNAGGKEMWVSGPANLKREPQIFEYEFHTWDRNTDSEYKMLNDLAQRLWNETAPYISEINKDMVNPFVTGNIKIVSEQKYCPSCTGVIQQFSEMFPNIKITIIDGVK